MNVGFELAMSVRPANWLIGRMHAWRTLPDPEQFVGKDVPEGFDAYARIFHPASKRLPDGGWEPLRWATVAEWGGKATHPGMTFDVVSDHLLKKPVEGRSWTEPFYSLRGDECRLVIDVLKGFTSTPERCYFLLWRGYGLMEAGPFEFQKRRRLEQATVQVPYDNGEEYLLFSGPLDAVTAFYGYVDGNWWYQAPNFWWPEDLSWCMGKDLYSYYTLVGGSRDCIDAILGHPRLEALPIGLEDKRIYWLPTTDSAS